MRTIFLITIILLVFSAGSFATAPIAGLDSLCVGASTTLSDTDPGGAWSSSATAVATVGTDGTVTGIAAGTSIISYTIGGSSAIMVMTVKPLPSVTIISTPGDTLCHGVPVELNPFVTAAGITSCTWELLGAYVGSGAPYIYDPYMGDSLNCIITGIRSCDGATYTVTSPAVHMVVMFPYITLSGRDSVCQGDRDTLIAHVYEAASLFWKPPTGLSCINCDTVISSLVSTTVYTVVATDILGCTDSTIFSVAVNPHPIITFTPNPITVCVDSSVQVFASGGSSYEWVPATGLSCSTCADPVASPASSIAYTLIGTNIHGCKDSAFVPVTVDSCASAGLQPPDRIYGLEIYPNPASTSLTISSSEKITSITLTDLLGQTVYTHEYNSEKVQLDVSALPSGIYFVEINGAEVRKFVKE